MALRAPGGKIARPGEPPLSRERKGTMFMASLSISRAWEEAKARIATDGRLMAVVSAALVALPTLISEVVNPRSTGGEGGLLEACVVLIATLFTIVGQLAIIRLALGHTISVAEAISHSIRRLPYYVVAGLLILLGFFILAIPFGLVLVGAGVQLDRQSVGQSGLAGLLGLLFFAIAIFIGTRMLMSSPVASEEEIGPIAILRRSWTLTHGHFLRLFAFIVMFIIGAGVAVMAISWGATFVAVILLGPVAPMSVSALLVAFVDAVATGAVTVVLAVTLARIYVQLVKRDQIDVTVPTSGT